MVSAIEAQVVAPEAKPTKSMVRIETGIVPRSVEDAERLAARLAKSGLMPKDLRGKPDDVLVVVLTGMELGLSPMQSVRSLAVINGKPVMSADLMVALCNRSAECLEFRLVESTAKAATYQAHRRGAEPVKLTWTMDQAKAAGLAGKDTWQKYPDAMLRARCASALARAVFPDLVLGVYEKDEGDELRGGGAPEGYSAPPSPKVAAAVTVVKDVFPEAELVEHQEQVEAPKGNPDAVERFAIQLTEAQTADELAKISEQIAKIKSELSPGEYQSMREGYVEAMRRIKAATK